LKKVKGGDYIHQKIVTGIYVLLLTLLTIYFVYIPSYYL